VIVRKGAFLKLYTTYISDFVKMNDHFEECCQRHAKFAKLVKEFEAQTICRKLKLQHYMLKPVQVCRVMGGQLSINQNCYIFFVILLHLTSIAEKAFQSYSDIFLYYRYW
jgi:hypothetical protein